MIDALLDPLGYDFFVRAPPGRGRGRHGLRGGRHVRGAARDRVHRRRGRARVVPRRRGGVPAGDPVLPRRGGRRGRDGPGDRLRDAPGADPRRHRDRRAVRRTFAFGVFLYSTIDGYVADLFSFLFGYLLSIDLNDLIALTALGALVLLIVGVFWKELLYATFDPLGAAASGLRVDGSSTCSSRSWR